MFALLMITYGYELKTIVLVSDIFNKLKLMLSSLEPPSEPQKLTIDRVTDKDVALTWKVPKSDGGSRIKQYKIYKKPDKPGATWTEVQKVDAFKTVTTVTDLSPDEKYTFAVMAENEMGLGEMAETDRPISLLKPISRDSIKYVFFHILNHIHMDSIKYMFSLSVFISY